MLTAIPEIFGESNSSALPNEFLREIDCLELELHREISANPLP